MKVKIKPLKIVVVLVILVGIVVGVLRLKSQDSSRTQQDEQHEASDLVSGDNIAETNKRLAISLNKISEKYDSVKKENIALRRDIQTIPKQVQEMLETELKNQQGKYNTRLDKLSKSLQKQTFSSRDLKKLNKSTNNYVIGRKNSSEIVTQFNWIVLQEEEADTINSFQTKNLLDNSETLFSRKTVELPLRPYLTINKGATLTGSTIMTSLIGRIPIKGKVFDPYPFKALLGKENLAANGLKIPNLDYAIVGGKVTGDMQLSCNRATLDYITFVFQDGRISTSDANDEKAGIGYLSTPTGNNCIPGKFYTNAAEFLATMTALSASQGAANAFAEAQYENATTALGGSMSTLTGSVGNLLLGRAVAGAAENIEQWWLDRQESSFDAIFTPSNTRVVINVEQQINIDYDPNGRKISYEDIFSMDNATELD